MKILGILEILIVLYLKVAVLVFLSESFIYKQYFSIYMKIFVISSGKVISGTTLTTSTTTETA